jgi:hypothetical protein
MELRNVDKSETLDQSRNQVEFASVDSVKLKWIKRDANKQFNRK